MLFMAIVWLLEVGTNGVCVFVEAGQAAGGHSG